MIVRILLITWLITGLAHAEIYKYTNKQGKTAYSDTSVRGAEKVVVPPVMTYKAPELPTKAPETNKGSAGASEQERVPYQSIEITRPEADSAVISNEGILNVSYLIQPALQQGDRVELIIDGVRQVGLGAAGLVRGEYTALLEMLNQNDEVQISSQIIASHQFGAYNGRAPHLKRCFTYKARLRLA